MEYSELIITDNCVKLINLTSFSIFKFMTAKFLKPALFNSDTFNDITLIQLGLIRFWSY